MQADDPTLASLDRFLASAMPAAMRKLRSWQGLSPSHHGDVVADLMQEVATDFIAHRASLEAMPTAARHERWLRLVGRSHYRLRGRDARTLDVGKDVDAIAVETTAPNGGASVPALDQADAALVDALLQHGVRLKNGRLNELITARSIGLTPRQLRRRGQRLIAALHADRDVEFWRRRLAEALVGLAADVLRDNSQVVIHGEGGRTRPDPRDRLRRVRRIRDRLRYLPLPTELRRVLARYGGKAAAPLDPAQALRAALELEPRAPQAHLWWFELAAVRGDHARAAVALCSARRCGGDRVAIVLARARLLEVRGRCRAAAALLARARRRREDTRLRISQERLCEALPRTG